MVVPMPDGTEVLIDHLPVTQVRETLGVWSSPDGNDKDSLVKMREKAQVGMDQAKEGWLRRRDVWFLLDVRFWPQVGYGICCNLAMHAKLERVLQKQYYHIIPLGGVVHTHCKRIVSRLLATKIWLTNRMYVGFVMCLN